MTGGTTDFRHFIHVNGQSVAVVSRKSTGTNASTYRLDDHLGSTEHLTDATGANVVMESFGAYGQRRGSNWTGAPTPAELTTITDKTRKGFTEHEMLDNRKLPRIRDSVMWTLPAMTGDKNEEVEIYGIADCGDFAGRRLGNSGC